MRVRTLLLPASLLLTTVLSSCSDPTGPTSGDYVHVFVKNASAMPIFVPAVRDIVAGQSIDMTVLQLSPGEVAEARFITPNSGGAGIAVYEANALPQQRMLGIVRFEFVRMTAGAAGRDNATLSLVATAQGSLTASTDRPDLITVTGVTSS